MESLVNQIKVRMSQMYSTIIDYFKSDELYAKVFDMYDTELFQLSRDTIEVVDVAPGTIAVLVSISSESIKEFYESHKDEEIHFIKHIEFWVNNSEGDILLHRISLNTAQAISDEAAEYSIRWEFTSNYVEAR